MGQEVNFGGIKSEKDYVDQILFFEKCIHLQIDAIVRILRLKGQQDFWGEKSIFGLQKIKIDFY